MKRVLGGLVIVAVSLCFVIGFVLWNNHNEEVRFSQGAIAYGIPIKSNDLEDSANKRRERFITQAKIIRQKWSAWANSHQSMILRMRRLWNCSRC